ncbi:hypothetical protein SteCoe_14190 [Stentor coeruleus]|uniref:Uncharacterized protein n=1 Tax=Stentor coeruleus TaxID=5963 RepID=A0A1R2C6M7_9CILI|nr:hypothetical protein SteCoe_14190 [Stentor coeruleus]
MVDYIFTYYPIDRFFIAIICILICFYLIMCIGTILRFKYKIISLYKYQVVYLLFFLFSGSFCKTYLARIIFLSSGKFIKELSARHFNLNIGTYTFSSVWLIVLYILIDLCFYFNPKIDQNYKTQCLKIIKIFFTSIWGMNILALIVLFALNDKPQASNVIMYYFLGSACLILVLCFLYSLFLIKKISKVLSESVYKKIKNNLMFFNALLLCVFASNYGIGQGFSMSDDHYLKYYLDRCCLFFLYFFCGDIIPGTLVLRYMYALKNISSDSFFDMAQDILNKENTEELYIF